ncbi:MAG: tetratricopeptide repeat protein [Actinomycetota bacterium]|nr:tetratricopeptide repeat protein [Actinomycetota bacterium]
MLDSLDRWAVWAVQLLEVVGAFTALALVIGLLAAIVRSTWKALAGRVTLVLPIRGSEKAGPINVILAQQLQEVETTWLLLSEELRSEQKSTTAVDSPAFVPLPPEQGSLHLDVRQIVMARDDPLEGQALGPIGFAGLNFSPDAIFALFYRIRTLVARRTITGTFHEFDSTVRFSTVFTYDRKPHLNVLVRHITDSRQLLDVIDDMAFVIARLRLGCAGDAQTWSGYKAFLEAYNLHLHFVRTGHLREREKAIEKYRTAVRHEPDLALAHYNLGTLLYNRYEAAANREAIDHFRHSAESSDEKLQALGLAGLALGYCQQAHRFGEDAAKVGPLADEASSRAVTLRGDLEETCFARAFSLQILGEIDRAIDWYTKTIDLPGGTLGELRLKSFASTNRGFLYLTSKDNLDRAEASFTLALEYFSLNQIARANLGEIYRRRQQYDKSIGMYREALQQDPRYVNAMNELGMVYVYMAAYEGDSSQDEHLAVAKEWHEKAVLLVPGDELRQLAELHERFGNAYKACGFADEAEDEFAEAARLRQAAAA